MNEMLLLSDTLSLPVDLVTATIAILAKRRSGKTYTANVLAEEMIGAGAHTVAIDPLGVWWGLRSGADGDPKGGLPVVIIGGDHADLPLDPAAGAAIADLVTGERLSCVLDVSRMSRSDLYGFVMTFLQRLFETNREPLHLFVDEADMLAPQKPKSKEQSAVLDAMDTLVRRGGSRGLGTTLITQRPAVINKDVLTQIDVLIALCITGPQDREAIDDWIKGHGTDAERKTVLDSLATMAIGEAWVWAPNHLESLHRTQIRRRRTFDASATPKVGESIQTPRALADVDMSALAKRFSAQLEIAAENDPELLRKRIGELEAKLAAWHPAERVEVPVPVDRVVRKIVEVPVLSDGEIARLEALRDSMAGIAKEMSAQAAEISARLRLWTISKEQTIISPPESAPLPLEKPSTGREQEAPGKSSPPSGARSPEALSGPQKRILDAIADFASLGVLSPARAHVAAWSGASPKSSSYTNNLSALRTASLIDYADGARVRLTAEGAKRAARSTRPPTRRQILEAWCGRVTGPQGKILRYIAARAGQTVARSAVANASGASLTSSSFSNNLSALRSLGLIDYAGSGSVRSTDLLVPSQLPE